MSDYEVTELGPIEAWSELTTPDGRPGKGFVDRMIPTQYIGLSANELAPGAGSAVWHAHAVLEEIYLFLEGAGQMALGEDVIDVRPGTTIRVGQGVMRAIHANADSPTPVRYLCIRAGDGELKDQPRDSERSEAPFPWA